MTMKSFADQHATEVLKPVEQVTEKLDAVPRVTEKLAVVVPATEKLAVVVPATEKLTPVVAAIPAQRQDSRPAPVTAHVSTPAQAGPQRRRWEHLPTEYHPGQNAPRQQAAPEPEPQAAPKQQAAPEQASPTPKSAPPSQPSKPKSAPKQQRWQRSAVATAPARGPLVAAGLAACDYLIRTVSILGLLAVVGMVTAGSSGTAQTEDRAPGTTVATSPAHPGGFTSTHHQH
jgi:hypothetical protein